MNLSLYSADEVMKLCFMNVNELDQEILKLTKKITQPADVTISFTSEDVKRIVWKIRFIQRIQNRKRRNPHRIVEHANFV